MFTRARWRSRWSQSLLHQRIASGWATCCSGSSRSHCVSIASSSANSFRQFWMLFNEFQMWKSQSLLHQRIASGNEKMRGSPSLAATSQSLLHQRIASGPELMVMFPMFIVPSQSLLHQRIASGSIVAYKVGYNQAKSQSLLHQRIASG